jgi:hypothetical protein
VRHAARLISLLALVATIAPPLLFFTGQLTLEAMKTWMLVATVVWFAATPLWMKQ